MLCVLGKLLDKFDERAWNIKTQKFGIINWDNKGSCPREGGGGGGLNKAERLRPKGVPLIRLRVYERVGISLVVVYARVGKSII